eukprot:8378544-Ditylum_brightwellii.AAC.1
MPAPATMCNKCPRPFLAQNDDLEIAKKCRKAKKEGWLKKLYRGSFCPLDNLSATCCSQHIIVGCSC